MKEKQLEVVGEEVVTRDLRTKNKNRESIAKRPYRNSKLYSPRKSLITKRDTTEGEPIEHKVERLVNNNEPITDGAPEIFTERKEGVISAYNIRTDRWEIAAEAMDVVQKSIEAKRDAKAAEAKAKAEGGKDVIDINKGKDGGAESTQGKATE